MPHDEILADAAREWRDYLDCMRTAVDERLSLRERAEAQGDADGHLREWWAQCERATRVLAGMIPPPTDRTITLW